MLAALAVLQTGGARAGARLRRVVPLVAQQFVCSAAAVVVLENRRAIVPRLRQALVHLVVDEAAPHGSALAGADLRRVLLQQLDEVAGTVAAGVHLGKRLDVALEVHLLALHGRLRVPGENRVQQLPCCVAQLRLECLVRHLRHEGRGGRVEHSVAVGPGAHGLLTEGHRVLVRDRVLVAVPLVLDPRLAAVHKVVQKHHHKHHRDHKRPARPHS